MNVTRQGDVLIVDHDWETERNGSSNIYCGDDLQ